VRVDSAKHIAKGKGVLGDQNNPPQAAGFQPVQLDGAGIIVFEHLKKYTPFNFPAGKSPPVRVGMRGGHCLFSVLPIK